ncbi:hypothetical protein H2199_005991 [Coniosporium tulheliwenetii]|uniref:Uncharacterized protein n=1 Tax=Coniosporium tulheliwenetii TaxID=3383036 RepID=A0ACC2YYQ1_9PEZI|nr:hypothetical protein H2199_005991 [Cladosporium sp. JES 115]
MHGGGWEPQNVSPVYSLHGHNVPYAAQSHGGGYVPGQNQLPAWPHSEPAHEPYRQHSGGSTAYSQYQQQYPQPMQYQSYDSGMSITPARTQSPAQSSLLEPDKGPVVDTQAVDEYNDGVTLDGHRATKQKGYHHIFDPYTRFRWLRFPHFYQKQGYVYLSAEVHRHKDSMWRISQIGTADKYLSPFDAKPKDLMVQAVDDIYDRPGSGTWKRTFIRNIAPWHLRLANWPTNHVDYRRGKPTKDDWPMIIAKWIPTSLALIFILGLPSDVNGQERNGGKYDAFPYRYYGYPKVARNLLEDPEKHRSDQLAKAADPIAERLLRPRHLCFLVKPDSKEMLGVTPMPVDEWISKYKSERILQYLFVAYTAEQFRNNDKDMKALHHIAEKAARDAGLPAYWIGCSCMPEQEKVHEDVFRISDVIRGAHSMVIAVGKSTQRPNLTTSWELLRQWGERIWTFPEVLLSPAGQSIKVYHREGDLDHPEVLAKNQFAARVWTDAAESRQLIDHYEGTLVLSRLELVTLALACLHSRKTHEYLPGDHSYALMGLLRLRPTIDGTDSAFQAFARLSLANDSDMLLERLICVYPQTPNQPWYSMDDAYKAKLWDIYPSCQIAGVGHDDTVILDGALAANVRWKSFATVRNLRRASWGRLIAQIFLHFAGYMFFVSIFLLASAAGNPTNAFFGSVLFLYSVAVIAAAPKLIRMIYGGKFWQTQPWLFGFEGYLDIECIERHMFGGRLERLRWTPFGSPLSRHHRDEYGDVVGDDPCSDPGVRDLVRAAKTAGPGEQKVFTLIDTYTMTVTLFAAARPPVAFLLVGAEGGMQRAVGCSLDCATGTLYRETVLRMETPVKEKMDRIPRARFGFRRPDVPVRRAEWGKGKTKTVRGNGGEAEFRS